MAALRLLGGALLALGLLGCSPEASRARGGGLGADPGNAALPIQMHGSPDRNNPSYGVPAVGRAPKDARGVAGWWSAR